MYNPAFIQADEINALCTVSRATVQTARRAQAKYNVHGRAPDKHDRLRRRAAYFKEDAHVLALMGNVINDHSGGDTSIKLHCYINVQEDRSPSAIDEMQGNAYWGPNG